ncbi:MAG: DUF998 domain-containing protein [Acidobacteria bacterium]|nr:DUF998 domain-containing protein [Acidobacteriota bacterium]
MTTPAEPTSRRSLVVRLFGVIGVAGVAYFVATFVVLHFVQWGLNPAQHFISEYALGRLGWLVTLAFLVVGVGTLALARGLHRSFEPGELVTTPVALITIAGISFIVLGIFKIDPLLEDGTTAYTPAGIAHLLAGLVLFLGLVVGAFVLRGVFAGDARWWGLEEATLRLALGMLVASVVMVAVPQQMVGLAQRAVVAIMLTWLAVLGWWMHRLDPVEGTPHKNMSYIRALSKLDNGSRARPTLSEHDEKIVPRDSWSGDWAKKRAATQPWLSIGQQFIEGIPAMKITRY